MGKTTLTTTQLNRSPWPRRLLAGGMLGSVVLSGCTLYHAAPLASTAQFAPVQVDDRALHDFAPLKAHPFNAADGLDVVEVEMLAVSHNPALVGARHDLGVTEAQSFAAGLLPDPQLQLAHDITHSFDVKAATSYGISYDFGALIAHRSTVRGARSATRQGELDLLWQEWQTMGQAQLLMTRVQMQAEMLAALGQQQRFDADRAVRSHRAMQDGNLPRDVANTDTVALQAINSKIDDLRTQQQTTLHDLNDLLGLAPDTVLNLQFDRSYDAGNPQATDPVLIQNALDHLPARRPDLQALQAGYESQDAKVYQAVLAQFPSLNVGLTRSKDNGGAVSDSLGISLSLPLFNHNRGNVAVEQATRAKLQSEYQSRLTQTAASVLRLQAEQAQQVAIWHHRKATLDQLRLDVARTAPVYKHGLVDDLLWINLNHNLYSQEQDLLLLEQSIREQRVGLNTLLGLPAEQSLPIEAQS